MRGTTVFSFVEYQAMLAFMALRPVMLLPEEQL
jgi:hypothetical protein